MSSSRGLQDPLLSREALSARLAQIFPEGTEQHANLTREMAVSTVFVMLYVGAIEGERSLGEAEPDYPDDECPSSPHE